MLKCYVNAGQLIRKHMNGVSFTVQIEGVIYQRVYIKEHLWHQNQDPVPINPSFVWTSSKSGESILSSQVHYREHKSGP